jgi:drug/metabolite transporter (DMT)-like permease
MTSPAQANRQAGLALVAFAALAWSSAGVFTRFISADLMTMLFWRGLFSGSAVFVLFVAIEGRRAMPVLRTLGWPALAVAFFSATGMITGIGSLRFTTVAEAMVIYATVPFMTAALAFLAIGERPTRATLAASALALAGVGVMMWGASWGGSLFGKGLAVLMALSMASFTVIMRRHRDVAMLPAMAASAWLCAAFCWFFATPLGISASDFILCALFGLVQNAVGLALYTFGSRRVAAAEATLVAALEVPLTPLWVLIFVGEKPGLQTLLGGAIVLTALFGYIVSELRKRSA